MRSKLLATTAVLALLVPGVMPAGCGCRRGVYYKQASPCSPAHGRS